jgi:hypothetical protein
MLRRPRTRLALAAGAIRPAYDRFDLLFKAGAWHHHAAATSDTDGTDVRAQPNHTPLIATTRVPFAETDDIIQP